MQGGQQQDSHELLGKLIEGVLAEEVKAAKALQKEASITPAWFGSVDGHTTAYFHSSHVFAGIIA